MQGITSGTVGRADTETDTPATPTPCSAIYILMKWHFKKSRWGWEGSHEHWLSTCVGRAAPALAKCHDNINKGASASQCMLGFLPPIHCGLDPRLPALLNASHGSLFTAARRPLQEDISAEAAAAAAGCHRSTRMNHTLDAIRRNNNNNTTNSTARVCC